MNAIELTSWVTDFARLNWASVLIAVCALLLIAPNLGNLLDRFALWFLGWRKKTPIVNQHKPAPTSVRAWLRSLAVLPTVQTGKTSPGDALNRLKDGWTLAEIEAGQRVPERDLTV